MANQVSQNTSERLKQLEQEYESLKALCHQKSAENEQLIDQLKALERMLLPQRSAPINFVPDYGDLSDLNKDGLIKKAIPKQQLQDIVYEYLDLLETSAAIYEKNGDYALGIFSSGWCQMMDAASRRLCNTDDNREALNSGQWLCHESCWKDASIESMADGKPVEVACHGGINLYAVPIYAHDQIIGAINCGFGSPPKEDIELKKLSKKYKIPIDDLRKQSHNYKDRPQFIIDYAKQRIQRSARSIGYLVERYMAEQTLLRTQHTVDKSPNSVFWVSPEGQFVYVNETAAKKLQYPQDELLSMHVWDIDPNYPQDTREEQFNLHREFGVRTIESEHRRSDGSLFPVKIHSHVLNYQGQEIEIAEVEDITERKLAEQNQIKNEIRLQSLIRILQYQTDSIQDFLDYSLDEAIKLTESIIGYIYYYDEEKKEFTLNTWSKGVMEQCAVLDPQTKYHLEKTGLWGEVVRQRKEIVENDFEAPNPLKKGHPKGHAPLKKYLSVPVFSDNEIVAVVGVANKETDYDNYDVLQLQLLMDGVWKEVERKKGLKALEESEEQYRRLFETMSQGVVYKAADEKIVSANPAAQQMLGLSLDQIKGKTSMDPRWKMITEEGHMVPGNEHPSMVALKTGKVCEPVIRGVYVPEKDEYRWLSITATPLFRPGDDKPFQSYAVFDDITLRKQHEDEIKKQQQLIHTTLKNLPIGIALNTIGAEPTVELVNDNFAEIYGLKTEKMPTVDSFWETVYEDEVLREELKQQVMSDIESGDPKRMQWHDIPITKNGKVEKYISAQNILLEDHGLIISTVMDTTERKLAEIEINTARNKAEEIRLRFETLFYESPVSIFIQDIETGEILDANKAAFAAYGYDSLTKLKQADFWMEPPYSMRDSLEMVKKAMRDGINVFEWKNRKVTGEVFWKLVTLRPLVIDGVERMLATAIDITDQKRRETEKEVLSEIANATFLSDDVESLLANVKNLLGKLIDTKNFYVAFFDEENGVFNTPYEADEKDRIETWPAAKSVTGLVLRKKKPLLLKNPALVKLMNSGEIEQIGNMCKVWLGVPLFSESKVIGVMAVQDYHNANAYDHGSKKILEFVSSQVSMAIQKKRYVEDLVMAKEKAQESNRLKSAFLANVSHEIRTPMNGIIGFSELLKSPQLTIEQQKQYLEMIEKSGERMLNIINDIVDISRIESGLMDVDLKEININEQLEYIYTFFNPQVEGKGMQLVLRDPLPPENTNTVTDREKLLAILTNLVKNAIKYSHKGTIVFGCQRKGSTLEFFVKDTGIGIPKERQQAVFDRFIQADIEDIEARQGAGLGLAISKAYVEMLGGEIWVQSEEGKGSVFYFTIPYKINLQEDAGSMTQTTMKQAIQDQALHLKILVAEDDEMSAILMKALVKNYGREILQARDGSEAVSICRDHPDIDLIMMDMKMPGMDGEEATRKIRQFNADVVIIAQTAKALTGDRESILEAGCNEYITKPVDKVQLHSLIEKYFQK